MHSARKASKPTASVTSSTPHGPATGYEAAVPTSIPTPPHPVPSTPEICPPSSPEVKSKSRKKVNDEKNMAYNYYVAIVDGGLGRVDEGIGCRGRY